MSLGTVYSFEGELRVTPSHRKAVMVSVGYNEKQFGMVDTFIGSDFLKFPFS